MIYGLALCAGIGAMDLGLRLAMGRQYRSVGYIERDPFAAAVLVARMEDQTLDTAPIWDDVSTFKGDLWRGNVDLVTAGFPCQPFSVSGKRKGLADHRWIWPDIKRILGEVQPSLVFLENVPGLARHGLPTILCDLRELGFDAEWDCFSAQDVEAPHQRERFWLLASHPGRGAARRLQQILFSGGNGSTNTSDSVTLVPNTPSERLLNGARVLGDQEGEKRGGRTTSHRCTSDTEGEGLEAERGPRQQEQRRSPEPGWWAPPSGVPLLAYGAATNVDRLRCSGNALVPAVAALAFFQLFQRLVMD